MTLISDATSCIAPIINTLGRWRTSVYCRLYCCRGSAKSRIGMKELLLVLALAVAAIQTASADIHESARVFHECMRELDIKSFQSEEFRTKFVCINVCEHEKAGMVIGGKYLEHKYIDNYVRSFPKAGPVQMSILIGCIREANKQNDKCDVGRSLQNCEMKSHYLLFEETRSDSQELLNNKIEEPNN